MSELDAPHCVEVRLRDFLRRDTSFNSTEAGRMLEVIMIARAGALEIVQFTGPDKTRSISDAITSVEEVEQVRHTC